MVKPDKTSTVDRQLVNSKFGKWGWSMIVYSFLLYFFMAGITTDGLNLLPDAFAAVKGWNAMQILSFATPAGILGVIGSFISGQFIIKHKPMRTSAVTLIISGVAYALFGFSPSPIALAVLLFIACFAATGFGMVVPPALMANWFPRKKGIALGWATMGAPACTAFFVPLLGFLLGRFGLVPAFGVIGAACVVLGVVTLFWVKDYPESVGAIPDNLPADSVHAVSSDDLKSYVSPFTIKKLLADKDLWFISLGFGCLWMVTVGIVSQFIPRMISVGYEQTEALFILTVAALIAMPGSYFWGWLDQKAGTKLASIVYAAFYIIALILLILELEGILVWIAAIFVGVGIGGLLNLMPSLVITVYGRYDFMAAYRLVAPIATIIRVLAFGIMATLLTMSNGSYTLPYTVFIFIDIIGLIFILLVSGKTKGKMD
ncbi:MAG: MFS transporter [Clostridiales Family XIII bacterium]|jgi:sugar phosphate permease|nr:MFS transporter [Clostridiales Family XIII bacterium]